MNDTSIRELCNGLGLYHGQLLGPEQADSLRENISFPWSAGVPILINTVSDRLIDWLERPGARSPDCRVTVYHTGQMQALLVLTVQCGPCQSRTLLDLHDRYTEAYLQTLDSLGGLPVLHCTRDVRRGSPGLIGVGACREEMLRARQDDVQLSEMERLYALAQTASRLIKEPELLLIGEVPPEEVTVCTVVPSLPMLERELSVPGGQGLH